MQSRQLGEAPRLGPRVPVTYALRGKLVPYDAIGGSWRFITLPKRQSAELRGLSEGSPGFGSLPCAVTVGSTTWRTSVFWSKAAGAYLLPVKASVRKAEGIADGAMVRYRLEIAV